MEEEKKKRSKIKKGTSISMQEKKGKGMEGTDRMKQKNRVRDRDSNAKIACHEQVQENRSQDNTKCDVQKLKEKDVERWYDWKRSGAALTVSPQTIIQTCGVPVTQTTSPLSSLDAGSRKERDNFHTGSRVKAGVEEQMEKEQTECLHSLGQSHAVLNKSKGENGSAIEKEGKHRKENNVQRSITYLHLETVSEIEENTVLEEKTVKTIKTRPGTDSREKKEDFTKTEMKPVSSSFVVSPSPTASNVTPNITASVYSFNETCKQAREEEEKKKKKRTTTRKLSVLDRIKQWEQLQQTEGHEDVEKVKTVERANKDIGEDVEDPETNTSAAEKVKTQIGKVDDHQKDRDPGAFRARTCETTNEKGVSDGELGIGQEKKKEKQKHTKKKKKKKKRRKEKKKTMKDDEDGRKSSVYLDLYASPRLEHEEQ